MVYGRPAPHGWRILLLAGGLHCAACFSPTAPVTGATENTSEADTQGSMPAPTASTSEFSTSSVGTASGDGESTCSGSTDASVTTGDDSTSTGRGALPCEVVNGEGEEFECSTYAQDCPTGERCVPYAISGFLWNATRCEPIAQAPIEDGEPCVDQADLSDFCGAGSVCWDFVCAPLCTCDQSGTGKACPRSCRFAIIRIPSLLSPASQSATQPRPRARVGRTSAATIQTSRTITRSPAIRIRPTRPENTAILARSSANACRG